MERQREAEEPIEIIEKETSKDEENDEDMTKKQNFFQNYTGIIYAILSGVCLLISDVIVRGLSHYHTSELIAYRVMVELVFLLPILIQQGIKFCFWKQAPFLILRGALLSCNFFLRIFSIQSLPLTESMAIAYSVPIVVAILSRVFLKYKFTKIKIAALITNLVALVLVCHFWTGFNTERYVGIGSGLLNLLVTATGYVILKKLTFEMQPKLAVFHVTWMRFVSMLVVTEISNDFGVPTIPECSSTHHWYKSEIFLIFIMGLAMLGFATFEAEAIKLENPSTVTAIIIVTVLPLAVVSQIMFFSDVPNAGVVVGVILVLMTSLMINFDGIVEKLSPESRLRRLILRINS